MVGRHFDRQYVLTARGVLDPSLARIGAEHVMQALIRHDVKPLLRSKLPNGGVARESVEANRREHANQLDHCRVAGTNRPRTKRTDRSPRSPPQPPPPTVPPL